MLAAMRPTQRLYGGAIPGPEYRGDVAAVARWKRVAANPQLTASMNPFKYFQKAKLAPGSSGRGTVETGLRESRELSTARTLAVRETRAKVSNGSRRGGQLSAEGIEALYAKIQRRDPTWQREAFDEFHSLVQRLLVRALGPGAEIEELLDDVFLSFFEHAIRIQAADKVRSYLVSITMNRVRAEIRRRRRAQFVHRWTGVSDEADQSPSSDDPKAKAALIQLSRILDELDAEERATFLLRTVEGTPFAEIAQLLSISESTAHRRARRANEHVMKKVARNALLCDYIRERTSRSK